MAWMMDEYSALDKFNSPGFITGKPIVLGGSQGRDRSTALGVVIAIEQANKRRGKEIKGSRVVIQGFGNAGSFLAKFLYDMGAKVVGISDAYGALHDPEGLDINYLLDRRDSFGTVTNLFDNTISNKELFELDCDILVPPRFLTKSLKIMRMILKPILLLKRLTDLLHLKLHEF